MIIKKKILSNELIKKNKKNIYIKDKQLFVNDLKNNTGESYCYCCKNTNIIDDGKIFTLKYALISDYLSFSSLSKFIFLKKIILYINYILKIFIKKFFTEEISLSGRYIMVHNRNSNGYFHWLTDTLPKIVYAKKKYNSFIIVLPRELRIKFILSSLKKLKIKFFFLKKNKNYTFNKLVYIGNLYPSGNPRKKFISDMKTLLSYKSKNKRRIYISRNKSHRRKISNEDELINLLKKFNFKTVYAEKISFDNQIKLFSSSNYVVGLHGAGLSNLIWMKEKSNILEIRPEKDLYLNCYFNLASLLNINYNYIICSKKTKLRSSKNSDYKVDIKLLKKKLDQII